MSGKENIIQVGKTAEEFLDKTRKIDASHERQIAQQKSENGDPKLPGSDVRVVKSQADAKHFIGVLETVIEKTQEMEKTYGITPTAPTPENPVSESEAPSTPTPK